MTLISRIRKIASTSSTQLSLHRHLTSGLTAVMLIIILVSTILFWPIPYLGFNVDPLTATIVLVEPGGSAADVGLQVGDRVLRIYGRSWDEVLSLPNVLSVIGPRERPVPISIERAGVVYTLALSQGVPTIAFQTSKVINLLLVMLCWLTGYILGIVRRHDASGSPMVAYFWLGMSGVLGAYFFAFYVSNPLMLAMEWLLLTIFVPLAVYIHVWFPVRPLTPRQVRVARSALIGSWALLNGGLAASIIAWRPSLIQLAMSLGNILPIGMLIGFIAIGIILHRAYRRTAVAHTRRQIRLIALACFFAALAWLLLFILPDFIRGEALIADHWINLLAGAVPLAYLIGGMAPDLYRIDRILLRLGIHAGTTALLAGLLAAIVAGLALHGTLAVLWTAICFVVLYRPVQRLGFRLLPAANPAHNTYQALHTAITKLTTTLDARTLVDAVCAGVRTTFGEPALAFYMGDVEGSNNLVCVAQERLPQLPATIPAGTLTDELCRLTPLIESRTLHTAFAKLPLSSVEEQILHHPGLVLWCPIRHVQGYLLAVLLLGMRGDLDPYRAEDMRELQRLLEAAVLAFANSAEYEQRCEAESTIRRLYQDLQQAQDATAAAIARELHDEIINVNVRLNIESLQKLIGQIHDPDLRAELELALESERTVGQTLRMICERLHPTGIDDPLGLAALLRMQVEKVQALWSGTCCLVVEQAPCPVALQTQREALRIAQEALTNAVKHAAATEIVVELRYPDAPGGMVQLVIRDNGRTGQMITARPGHWGVRNMSERARAVGGTLAFRHPPDGGTAAVFTFASESATAACAPHPIGDECSGINSV